MKNLPNVSLISSPFAKSVFGYEKNTFLGTDENENITFEKGIPESYSQPYYEMTTSTPGPRISVTEMNEIGYISTLGTFKLQCGIYDTYNPEVSSQIGGYPKGALLKWFQFSLVKPDPEFEYEEFEILFDGKIREIDTSATYQKGDIVYIDRDYLTYLWAVKSDDTSGQDVFKYLETYAYPVVVTSVVEVMSLVDNNTSDFRYTGPTKDNNWVAVDQIAEIKYPDYEQLTELESEILSGRGNSDFRPTPVRTDKDGWIVIRCERELLDDSISTISGLLDSYSDGVIGSMSFGADTTQTTMSIDFRFGPSDSIVRSIPVKSGTVIDLTINNKTGSDVSISVRLVGSI